MHVHSNPTNPNTQLDALSSAQRAESKREAARVRKKLSEAASELTGEAESGEACVVRLGTREESEDPRKRQEQRGNRENQKDRTDAAAADISISDWA
jgi:hypothetical protein